MTVVEKTFLASNHSAKLTMAPFSYAFIEPLSYGRERESSGTPKPIKTNYYVKLKLHNYDVFLFFCISQSHSGNLNCLNKKLKNNLGDIIMGLPYEELVDKAKEGNKDALEELIKGIQDQIYGLSLRMLGDPSDAEDAAQEILIKILTRLDSFRGESSFTTWTFRVASNYLLNKRKQLANTPEISAEDYQAMLETQSVTEWPESIPEGERYFITKEVMLTCTQGILLYLDYPHRITFILGEIFEITSKQGAYILDISPAAFRKRLSRARNRINKFMSIYCDLINPDGLCNCEKVSPASVDAGWIDPHNLKFAKHPSRSKKDEITKAYLKELDSLQRIAVVFQSHPDYAAPESYLENIRKVIHSEKYTIFQHSH